MPADTCYHQACDTTYNIDKQCLGWLCRFHSLLYLTSTAKANAYVVQELASQSNLKSYLSGAKSTSQSTPQPSSVSQAGIIWASPAKIVGENSFM